MDVTVKAKFTKEEIDAVKKVYDIANKFTDKFTQYTQAEAVKFLFKAMHNDSNEVEVFNEHD